MRFCSWLLALTPDLSYASAAVLAEQLFLKRVSARAEVSKIVSALFSTPFPYVQSPPPIFFSPQVLSLTQPPSRHLMAALTSFCSKYSQPFCQVLVAPVLREPGEGVLGSSLPVGCPHGRHGWFWGQLEGGCGL